MTPCIILVRKSVQYCTKAKHTKLVTALSDKFLSSSHSIISQDRSSIGDIRKKVNHSKTPPKLGVGDPLSLDNTYV
ncbi:hypothetical protein AVEN_240695-1 [Araneus ventricosus]|uniref:Uncharacterized protein n=1 Tax=Araneus ventricosus TaxID=182803 RepID=A0A4Y2S0J3_ARAVE|nr:hypothetical protein AVEN_240695-1 [Araneus ventricosus]